MGWLKQSNIFGIYDFKKIDDKLAKIVCDSSNDLIETLAGLGLKTVVYHNEAEFNVKKYFEKKRYYAKSFAAYINKWGKDDPDIKKQFGFGYRYFGVFIENGKWKRFLRYPVLVTGVFLLRFLVGISFIFSRFR